LKEQQYLINEVKLAKACTTDLYYRDLADALGMSAHAFYNWMKGYYSLSIKKEKQLHEIVIDLIDPDLLK
jgi:hypothetical protein